jgi:hypothetical protein
MKKSRKIRKEVKSKTTDEIFKETAKNNTIVGSSIESDSVKVEQVSSDLRLNLNGEDFYQGVILSEILGKPLSKRRNRRE